MPSIFISYRRRENSADARALYERLCREFGEDDVFIDLDGIEYGVDFVETLERQLTDCKVLLALIGPDWLTATDQGAQRRIDDENDFVRIEVATGLRRGIRIVPVLTDGALMPNAQDLPPDLRALTRRQAMKLDYGRFSADAMRLCQVLKPLLAAAVPPPQSAEPEATTVGKKPDELPIPDAVSEQPARRDGPPQQASQQAAAGGRSAPPAAAAAPQRQSTGGSTAGETPDPARRGAPQRRPQSSTESASSRRLIMATVAVVVAGAGALWVLTASGPKTVPPAPAAAVVGASAQPPVPRADALTVPTPTAQGNLPETAPIASSGETIKIGVLHSLSGTMAVNETVLKDTVLMAIDEINAKGGVIGRNLEPVVVDPASNWPLFAEKAKQMISQDKVAVMFGCWTSVSRKSVLPVVEKLNGLLFYPVQHEGEELSKNVFYTGAVPNQQCTA